MKHLDDATVAELCRSAHAVRSHAHAPYSRFHVGAALLAESGRVISGCNIENSTYGLTICAERVAVFKALSEGDRRFIAIAISAPELPVPCGACRQILWEFCGDIPVFVTDDHGESKQYRLADLLPEPFDDRKLS